MAAAIISAEDMAYEEEVLRQPFKLGGWLRYLAAPQASPLERRTVIYERALRTLPGSYKLWHAYLTERVEAARTLPVTDRPYAALNVTFERALAAGMSRMPRVWVMYASALLDQGLLTPARRALDRALRALPVTQHHRVWPLLLRLASLPACPADTALRVLRRYLQFTPSHTEDLVDFLVSASRWRDAAGLLASALNDDQFRSVRGKTEQRLWLDLCGLLAQHPEDVAGLPVEAILRAGIRKFPDEAGALWTSLAGYYARRGLCDKARDVFEEGITTVATVRDFRLVFEAYAQLEQSLLDEECSETDGMSSMSPLLEGCWLADRDDTDLRMARLEQLLERRPELLNRVQIRQNPHDVEAWKARARLFGEDPEKQASIYVEAVKTVDPMKAVRRPHTLWVAFAKVYENHGVIDSAREIFQRATQVAYRSVDHLATVWCEWAEMEMRRKDAGRALALLRQATAEPSVEVKRRAAAEGNEPVQIRLHKSLKLWCLYADLTENHGTLESTCDVYEKMQHLGLMTPELVLNYASILEEQNRFEDAFRVYERGVKAFKCPHAEALWAAYLTKLVQRHGKSSPERVRDCFQEAVQRAPLKAIFLQYAKFEEDFGLAIRAMKVYEEAARAVPGYEKLAMYEICIARAGALFGLPKTREMYCQAIHSGLPDKDARTICIRFAELETSLGEIDRARALYVYTSGFTDPRAHADFWKRWNDFEVAHGDENTFREMLRVKRTVTVDFASTGVAEQCVPATLLQGFTRKRHSANRQIETSGAFEQQVKRLGLTCTPH